MISKLAIIGNAGGGKTTLAKNLGKALDLPVFHVDTIQFLPGMKVRARAESIAKLNEIEAQGAWIIEGYGPLETLEKRLFASDQIILIDLPLWRHYAWSLKRIFKHARFQRAELPEDCNEFNLKQTQKLFRTIWKAHVQMRPELLRILDKPGLVQKTKILRSPRELLDVTRPDVIANGLIWENGDGS